MNCVCKLPLSNFRTLAGLTLWVFGKMCEQIVLLFFSASDGRVSGQGGFGGSLLSLPEDVYLCSPNVP